MPVQRGASEAITLDGSRYRIVPGSYKTDELEALATQIRSGLLSPADRANEFISSAKSWHLGFGLGEIRDTADLDRYHYAVNVDARIRGQLVLGPLLSTTAWTD